MSVGQAWPTAWQSQLSEKRTASSLGSGLRGDMIVIQRSHHVKPGSSGIQSVCPSLWAVPPGGGQQIDQR